MFNKSLKDGSTNLGHKKDFSNPKQIPESLGSWTAQRHC